MFKGMRENIPQLVPLMSQFYGHNSTIRFNHRAEGPMKTQDGSFIESCVGGKQGCPIASTACCMAYHLALHQVQKLHKNVTIICFADDTYILGTPEEAKKAHESMQIVAYEQCSLITVLACNRAELNLFS